MVICVKVFRFSLMFIKLSWYSNLITHMFVISLHVVHSQWDDSLSIRRRNSTWKVRRDFIDFERWIHVKSMTSIRRGNFNVDSTLKFDEISMRFPRGFFYVVSLSNRRNCFTHCSFLSFSTIFYSQNLF